MNKEAKNMEAIYKAKENHDNTCPYGGAAVRVLMTYFDIHRMGWEEGDEIAGMTLMGSDRLATGRIRVECDAEPQPEQLVVEEAEDKDLIHA